MIAKEAVHVHANDAKEEEESQGMTRDAAVKWKQLRTYVRITSNEKKKMKRRQGGGDFSGRVADESTCFKREAQREQRSACERMYR